MHGPAGSQRNHMARSADATDPGRNDNLNRQTYQLFSPSDHRAVEVEPTSVKPIFTDLPLGARGLVLRHHTGRILGFWQYRDRDVLVLYGFAQRLVNWPDQAWSGSPSCRPASGAASRKTRCICHTGLRIARASYALTKRGDHSGPRARTLTKVMVQRGFYKLSSLRRREPNAVGPWENPAS